MPKYLVDHGHDNVTEEVEAEDHWHAAHAVAWTEYGEDMGLNPQMHPSDKRIEWFDVFDPNSANYVETYIVVEVSSDEVSR